MLTLEPPTLSSVHPAGVDVFACAASADANNAIVITYFFMSDSLANTHDQITPRGGSGARREMALCRNNRSARPRQTT